MIIGVSGFAGSGKDTVADGLCKNPRFIKLAFADGIKRICKEVFDWTQDDLWGPSAMRSVPDLRYPREGGHLTPRYALQKLGTEWGRDCYENIWVEYALRLAKQLVGSDLYRYSQDRGVYPVHPAYPMVAPDNIIPPWEGVVIPDCRFKNEFALIRAAGAKLVRVKRKGLDKPPWDHPSETEQTEVPDDYFDYVFQNDGALEDVPAKIATMMEKLAQ